ncbi:MAG TPA: hypothetical protein VM123_12955 [archaeon]|nr:hypothetical protein [archaeon]
MQANIIKLAFLLSYLTLLICVVSGLPFMTALFRSFILLVLFIFIGLFLHWYLLITITSLEPKGLPRMKEEEEGESFVSEEDTTQTGIREDIEQL